MKKADLRALLTSQLEEQGFSVVDRALVASFATKAEARERHSVATKESRDRARPALERFETRFLAELAVERPLPKDIQPAMVLVPHGDSFDARLWRWVSLHWSIPVSSGYGRRMRFLIRDAANGNALIGIVGLTDPVFSLKARDQWFGWNQDQRRSQLRGVMEAFALGSVPPYDSMLGGKLVAMLAASSDVVNSFGAKYGGTRSRILGRLNSPDLIAITTQSAFGRSSLYNRISAPDKQLLWRHIGYTRGTGDFHLGGEVYRELLALAKETVGSGARGAVAEEWKSSGFRNRRDVLDVALRELGLDSHVLREHGVKRGVYVAPLVDNIPELISGGGTPTPRVFNADALTRAWVERWGENGAVRPASSAASWRLYSDG